MHDPDSRRMIVAVLTASLVMDALLVFLGINPQVMFVYGLMLVAALVLAFRGNMVPARLAIPLGGLILFSYLMFINKGIRDIALLGLPLIIIASGLLFGKVGTLVYGVLCMLAVVSLNVAEANGWIPHSTTITNTNIDYFAAEIAIVLVAILQWLVIDRLNRTIRRAQQNEEAQIRANEALRASEARFRLLIEESPEGILITNEDGNIILVNPVACKLLGYEETELLGSYAPDLIDPSDLAHRPIPLDDLHAGEIVQRDRLLVRKDGSRIPVIGNNRQMPDGTFQYIFQDMSSQKQAEAERELLIRELENKNAELEQFTYTVSHDLKSPLVTIRGFLGYLEEDLAKGKQDRAKDDIDRIGSAADRMNRLLKDLLELSRIGRIVNPPQDVPFETLAREAVELLQGSIKARGVRVHIQPNLPNVRVDRVRLIEVLQNLIDNAVKFMGGQTEPSIEIGVMDNSNPPIFFVRDNGIGIPAEFHERIFGIFNRLDQSVDGTGIGLTLVKRIIEVHGGRIWVESEGEGKGATFYFTLVASSS